MENPIAVWHEEHVYFGQLLRLLRRELDAFHSEARPNYELMLDVITYLREYSDRFHHPREDVAFGCLRRHRPEMALPLARLRQEHRVIAQAGETLFSQINAILSGAMVSRPEVEVALATYLVYYGNHISKEEEDVLSLASKVLTLEDWAKVSAAAAPVRDPLFGEHPEERYRELRRQIALET
jgi:hemerythrin-like domain-containing protein